MDDIFSREKSPAFIYFKKVTQHLLEANPQLQRLDCLNPIKSLKPNFEFVHAPEISLKDAWKEYLGLQFSNSFISKGVRDTLGLLFHQFKSFRWSIPSNVYPVYQNLAELHELKYKAYDATDLGNSLVGDFVLLTYPFFGKDLNEAEVDFLVNWLKHTGRTIVIDRVYDYQNNPLVQKLIDTNQVILCYSLSKTHLHPLLCGFNIVPEKLKFDDSFSICDEAKVLLTKYKDFPKQQESLFQYRWKKLGYSVPTGYLCHTKSTHENFIDNRQLVVPGDVYNRNGSVISCLHESLGGQEEVERYYVTVVDNFVKGYDKYSRKYTKPFPCSFPDKFFVCKDIQIGINKTRKLVERLNTEMIVLKTKVKKHELIKAERGEYLERNWIEVTNYDVDDLYSRSLLKNKLYDWQELKPRSISVLPIASSCQAKCSFCFSHSSISDEQKQSQMFLGRLDKLCKEAKERGAERMVITGGGEPTLHRKINEIISIGNKYFDRITMITNGHLLGHDENRLNVLQEYERLGLTNLSVSRHAIDNEKIMKLDTKSELIAKTFRENNLKLKMRWVCVLQKEGVHDEKSLVDYLDWVSETKVGEICFKELYVALDKESIYSDNEYNRWCAKNQVQMKLVLDFLIWNCAEKVDELPWGSPIYLLPWKGQKLKIAVYTEPSIFWERSNKICRSWNVMADGLCYANLETKDSLI